MFGWLFGKKKKENGTNMFRQAAMRTKIGKMSRREQVRKLRSLRTKHSYNLDIDLMYADDMLEELIMLYIFMEMTDIVSECDSDFYMDDEVVEEAIVEELVEAIEETPEVPSIYAEGGTLDMTKIDEEIEKEPTPIAVEETVVEVTESFSERTSSFESSCDSGSSYDSGSSCDTGVELGGCD